MGTTETRDVLQELGVRRIINASGNATVLGGSIMGPTARAAMEDANEYFVEMEELLEKSGIAVANLLGAEAALVTSGCFAAMVLGAAGIMTGKESENIARLPDTSGMKDEFLLQKSMHYPYERCVTVPGGKLVDVGDERGTTAEQLEEAIGPRTAGILYLARAEDDEGVLSIPEVVSIASRRGVAVLVDAAAEIYPLERMTWLAGSGAELVCFGAKYFGSANSTGVLCGRKDMVEAAALHNFISFETQGSASLGRGYKVDRQEVVATVVALREWFTMNHEDRFAVQEERIHTIARALTNVPHVTTERYRERQGPWFLLRITFDESALGKTAASIEQALRDGDPPIRVRVDGGQIRVAVHTLREGEDSVVAERMREVLSS